MQIEFKYLIYINLKYIELNINKNIIKLKLEKKIISFISCNIIVEWFSKPSLSKADHPYVEKRSRGSGHPLEVRFG